jgi:hypothetical protein
VSRSRRIRAAVFLISSSAVPAVLIARWSSVSLSHHTKGEAMRPYTKTVLAAAAAAAVAAGAVVALPATGDSGTTATVHTTVTDQGPDMSGLVACLANHGLPGAPTTAADLKPWLAHQDPDVVGPAMDACQSSLPDNSASGPDPATVIACVRSHGIDAPTAPADFKRWLADQQQAGGSKALDDALVACKIAPGPQDKAGKPDHGAPTDKQPATKPDSSGGANTK